MQNRFNQSLSMIANGSALSRSATPVLICDERMRMCMYTPSLAAILPSNVLGKDMSGLVPPETLPRLLEMKRGYEHFRVKLPDYDNAVSVIVNQYSEQSYYAFLFDGSSMLCADTDYITQAKEQIVNAVDELLHQKKENNHRLSALCFQLRQLNKYAQIAADTKQTTADTELPSFISSLIDQFNPQLAVVGASISMAHDTCRVTHCACPSTVLNAILSTLVSTAVCLSADGIVQLACQDMANHAQEGCIRIIVPNVRYGDLASFDAVAERMSVLRLDLMAVRAIADSHGLPLFCGCGSDGAFSLELAIPYAMPGTVTLHSPAFTLDTFALRSAAAYAATIIRLEQFSADWAAQS